MKRVITFLMVVVSIVFYVLTSDGPKVDHFVTHTIQHNETAGDIIARYNGGDPSDKDTQEGLILLNPHLKGKWEGEKITVPVFVQ